MNAIFAVNKVDSFGDGVDMPWPHSGEDLRRFKEITYGHTVVIGGGTWRSNMPKPLPGRRNCVLSNTIVDPRCEVYSDISGLLMGLQNNEEVYVIGGAKVLWGLRRYIKRVYLTRHRTIERATVTLDIAKYLGGFTVKSTEELDNLVFEVWDRV